MNVATFDLVLQFKGLGILGVIAAEIQKLKLKTLNLFYCTAAPDMFQVFSCGTNLTAASLI